MNMHAPDTARECYIKAIEEGGPRLKKGDRSGYLWRRGKIGVCKKEISAKSGLANDISG